MYYQLGIMLASSAHEHRSDAHPCLADEIGMFSFLSGAAYMCPISISVKIRIFKYVFFFYIYLGLELISLNQLWSVFCFQSWSRNLGIALLESKQFVIGKGTHMIV